MKHLKKISISAAGLVAALTMALGLPAFALETSDNSGDGSQTQSSRQKLQADRQEAKEARQTAMADRQEVRSDKKELSQAEHQKRCEAHKQGLDNKFSHIVTNSQRIQDRISGVLDKAQAYQQKNNLQVANYDSLVAAAESAKTASADSIANLKTVTPSLDCNNISVASDVAAFKTAAQATRDNLKAYRTAVKAVLQALQAAKPDTAEGSAQ